MSIVHCVCVCECVFSVFVLFLFLAHIQISSLSLTPFKLELMKCDLLMGGVDTTSNAMQWVLFQMVCY